MARWKKMKEYDCITSKLWSVSVVFEDGREEYVTNIHASNLRDALRKAELRVRKVYNDYESVIVIPI